MRSLFVGGVAAGLTLAAALSSGGALAASGSPASASPGGGQTPAQAAPPSPDASAPVILPGAGSTPIVATDVTLTLGKVRIVVPRLEARGTELTKARLSGLFDPSSQLSSAERLDALTAASLVAPRIEIWPAEGHGEPIVLTGVALTDVVKGRVGALSIGKVAIDWHESAGAGSASLGPVAAAALDLPLALSLARSHRSDAAEGPGLLLGSLSTGNMAMRGPDGSAVSLGDIALAGLRARAPLRPYAELQPLFRKPEGTLTPEDKRQLAEAAIDAAGSVVLGHLALEKLAFLGANDAVKVEAGRVVLDDVSPARVGTWAADDIGLVADGTEIALRHFALHGPDETMLLSVLARSFVSGDVAVQSGAMPLLPAQDGSMALIDLRVSTPSEGTPGNNADGTRTEVTIPVVSASTTTAAGGAVTGAAEIALDYALPKPEVLPQADVLRSAGIDTLHAGLDWRMAFDQGARELRLGRFAVSAEKLGSLATTLTLGDLPASVPSGDEVAGAAAARAMTLREAGFTFNNAGLVELALPAMAASANTSIPMLKAGLKTEAELEIGKVLGTSPTATRLVAAVDAFIDDPKSFTLRIEAPGGLKIGEIQDASDPTALLDRLGIEATANR